MMKLKNLSFISVVLLSLSGCGEGDSKGIFELDYQRQITQLNFSGLHKNNDNVTITSSCEYCDPDDIQYQIWVDKNDDELFSDNEQLNRRIDINDIVDWPEKHEDGPYTLLSSASLALTPEMLGHRLQVKATIKGTVTSESLFVSPPPTVKHVLSSNGEGAALTDVGTVISWGEFNYGGYRDYDTWDFISVTDSLTNVKDIYRNTDEDNAAFAALLNDGTVKTWGESGYGGDGTYRDFETNERVQVAANLTNVKQIYSNAGAFAALLNDGTVKTWGYSYNGGDGACEDPDTHERVQVVADLSNVKDIVPTNSAFAALLEDGSVKTWGNSQYGGDGTYLDQDTYNAVQVAANLSGVAKIYSNQFAFVAILNDGTVKTWGDSYFGGDGTYEDLDTYQNVQVAANLTNIKSLTNNGGAFTALLEDGTVKSWGKPYFGGAGGYYSHGTYHQVTNDLINVKQVFGYEGKVGSGSISNGVFVAQMQDNSIRTWGTNGDCEGEGCFIDGNYGDPEIQVANTLSNVKEITNSQGLAFAALLEDGTVQTWGSNEHGGNGSYREHYSEPWTQVTNDLTQVTKVVATEGSMAALNEMGSVVMWGGNYNIAYDKLEFENDETFDATDFVKEMFPYGEQFAMVMKDGSIYITRDNNILTQDEKNHQYFFVNQYNAAANGAYVLLDSTL